MGNFILGALVGLVAGIVFGVPIWNWVKTGAKKVENAVEKNQTPKP